MSAFCCASNAQLILPTGVEIAFVDQRQAEGGKRDDLIFVILAKEDGTRVAHSGRPFENTPFLNYSAAEFIIPAGSMENGHSYALSVEHAILDD
jgi:hypothetical protein